MFCMVFKIKILWKKKQSKISNLFFKWYVSISQQKYHYWNARLMPDARLVMPDARGFKNGHAQTCSMPDVSKTGMPEHAR